MIQDYSDHGALKEPRNSCPDWFLGSLMHHDPSDLVLILVWIIPKEHVEGVNDSLHDLISDYKAMVRGLGPRSNLRNLPLSCPMLYQLNYPSG